VFVLTSSWEGLPIAVLEAMAASLPIMATQTGGIKEVVKEGETGLLVTPRHTEKMAEKLSYLLRDERLRRQIGQSASASLDSDFSLENMGKHTENLYCDLVLKKGVSHAH
jgi:glycosyltransferase involved in cell wall biosynthesis